MTALPLGHPISNTIAGGGAVGHAVLCASPPPKMRKITETWPVAPRAGDCAPHLRSRIRMVLQ